MREFLVEKNGQFAILPGMIRRIAFDIGAIAVLFLAPWWIALAYAAIGVVLFPWYLESVFMGLFFDVVYGGASFAWYFRMVHTVIFTVPVAAGEFIKRRVNM